VPRLTQRDSLRICSDIAVAREGLEDRPLLGRVAHQDF
jgi:hypothetical protein